MKKKSVILYLIMSATFQSSCLLSESAESQKTDIPSRWRLRALWKALQEASQRLDDCVRRHCDQEAKELQEAQTALHNLQQKGYAEVQREASLQRTGTGIYARLKEKDKAHRICRKNRCKKEWEIEERIGRRLAGSLLLMSTAVAPLAIGGALAAQE